MSWAVDCPSARIEKLAALGFRISFTTTFVSIHSVRNSLFDQPLTSWRHHQAHRVVVQNGLQPTLDASQAGVHLRFGSQRRALTASDSN
jgi:hypothetical protein